MASGGQRKRSTWDRCVAELLERGSTFRMEKQSQSSVIRIREIRNGLVVDKFSSREFRWKDAEGVTGASEEAQIEACKQTCIRASQDGAWPTNEVLNVEPGGELGSWAAFALFHMRDLEKRVVIKGSQKNARAHLDSIALLPGKPCVKGLEKWALQKDPIALPGAFRNRIETLGRIAKAEVLDLTDVLRRLRAKKIKKASSLGKRINENHERPRVIPNDDQIFLNLKSIKDPVDQWAFAVQNTYGLRNSEVWHVEEIDEDDWLHVGPMTKTGARVVRPCLSEWVKEFKLRQNMHLRDELDSGDHKRIIVMDHGKEVCTNNDDLGNWLLRRIELGKVPKIWGVAENQSSPTARRTSGRAEDYCRPYDFRHAYAIRLFTNKETYMLSDQDYASYMGHGEDVHRTIYRKWMPSERKTAALKARSSQSQLKNSDEALPEGLTPELIEMAIKLRDAGL